MVERSRLKKRDKNKIRTLFKHGLSNGEISKKLGFKDTQVSGQTRKLKKDLEVMKERTAALALRNDKDTRKGAGEKRRNRVAFYYKRGWSNTRIAEKMGVSVQTVAKWIAPLKQDAKLTAERKAAKEAARAKKKPAARKGKRGRKKSTSPPPGTDEIKAFFKANPSASVAEAARQLNKPYSYVRYRRKHVKVTPAKRVGVRKTTIPVATKEVMALIPKGYRVARKKDSDLTITIHLRKV